MTAKISSHAKITPAGAQLVSSRQLAVDQVEASLRRDSAITIGVLLVLATAVIAVSFFP